MSRRKQANPRSFKLSDEMKLVSVRKEMISNGLNLAEIKLEPQTGDDSSSLPPKDKDDEIKIKVERLVFIALQIRFDKNIYLKIFFFSFFLLI